MKALRKAYRRGLLVLAIILPAAFLAGCGPDDPTGQTTVTQPGMTTFGTATAGLNLCMQCHPAVTAEWYDSRHASVNSSPSSTSATCRACHDKNGDSQQVTPNRNLIGCESCHGPGSLHVAGGGSGPIMNTAYSAGVISGVTSSLAVSGQLLTCMGCHQLLNVNDPASLTTPTTAMHSSTSGSVRVITDTHFAVPNTWNSVHGRNTSTSLRAVTGYALDYTSETVCTACHNPHGKVDILQEWAQSAHADRTTFHKDPKGYFTGAWSYYNWSCDKTSTDGCGSFGTPSDRRSCQRCHTTSAFSAYASALQAGNTGYAARIRNGEVSSLVTYTAGWKPEMLKCDGCHSDFKGTLRNPGAISADYSYSTTTNNIEYVVSTASHNYPDVNRSNICMACHTGRESGDTIRNLVLGTAPSITTFRDISFINSHYLTAGGTVFTATGYEFDSRSYTNPNSYQHSSIGVNDFRSAGTAGPCVGCHMSRPNGNGDHLFLPVSRFDRVRYNTGTVSVTQDNAVVTGAGTVWSTAGTAGIDTATDLFIGPDKRTYQIAGVDNTTQLTLTTPYRGSTAASQLYVITRSGDRIVDIASEVCFNCHAGATTALADQLNQGRELYEEALFALQFYLDRRGFCFIEAWPYFHNLRHNRNTVSVTTGSTIVTGASTTFAASGVSAATDRFRAADGEAYEIQSVDSEAQITLKTPYLGPTVSGSAYAIMISGSTNAVKDWDPANAGSTAGRNNMGAAFNFNLLEHDPGAYVHNRTYVKRLIYDSIDWLDDYTLNNSVGASLNALSGSVYAWRSGAMTYLLPYGVLGIPAERP